MNERNLHTTHNNSHAKSVKKKMKRIYVHVYMCRVWRMGKNGKPTKMYVKGNEVKRIKVMVVKVHRNFLCSPLAWLGLIRLFLEMKRYYGLIPLKAKNVFYIKMDRPRSFSCTHIRLFLFFCFFIRSLYFISIHLD